MLTYAKINNKKSTFLGLVSDGGVHPIPHLRGLIDATQQYGLQKFCSRIYGWS
jgi:2,3-bisphosphoglycerate-independent phosphoglycerate mutase